MQEIQKCRPAAIESKILGKRMLAKDKIADADESEEVQVRDAGEDGANVDEAGNLLEEEEVPKKKRKRGPKGVNPLAMKKPSKKNDSKANGMKRNRQHRKRGKGGVGGVEDGGE